MAESRCYYVDLEAEVEQRCNQLRDLATTSQPQS